MMDFMNLNFLYFYMFFLSNFMIYILIIPSNLFKFHPLFLSLLLILFILLLVIYMSFFLSTYWYSYVVFLVMIGGLMILFMYFTSLSSNQLSMLDKNYYLYMYMKFIIYMFMNLFIIMNFDFLNNLMNFYSEDLFLFINILNNCEMFMIKNLMMDFTLDVNLYMIIYLFYTMICSVLICGKLIIPMRQLIKF